MPRIVFTPNLQRHVSCPPAEFPGRTVRELLQAVFAANGRARGYVLDEQGSLRKHIMVFVNGEQIHDRIQLSDAVPLDGEVYVMSMMLPDGRDGSMYVAIDHGHFGTKVQRSRDGGGTWEEIATPAYPPGPETPEAPNPFTGKAVSWRLEKIWSLEAGHADQPGVLWCGTIPGGLFRSADGGSSWDRMRSLWDNPKRLEWFGGGADLPGIHSVSVDPRDRDHVIVGVSCGGVWATTDAGKTWNCRADGIWAAYMPPERKYDPNIQDPRRVVLCPAQPDCLWVQHHNGVFRSKDGATSWQEIPSIKPSVFGFTVAVHPRDPETAWFVPAVKDERRIPVEGKVVVARTRDGGQTYEVLRRGLPQEHAYDITFRHGFDVDDSGDCLAFGTTTGSLWISNDQGDSWQSLSHHLPPVYCVRFVKEAGSSCLAWAGCCPCRAASYDGGMRTAINLDQHRLRAGMVGLGMIFDETYRPLFEQLHAEGMYRADFGFVAVELAGVATRTGWRAERYRSEAAGRVAEFTSFTGTDAVRQLVANGIDLVCVATPDDRHFEAARVALEAGKHVLIEKPSVLRLHELDILEALAHQHGVLAKVVYHKLADPDHKKLRTHVVDGVLRHVNNGYCSLLEPKQISGSQFSEWITGRNPGTYVAVHYLKLIDFTFGPSWQLARVSANGQRGLVGPADGSTWDSVELQVVYAYSDGREAAFDIHTSWVTPDNFPGYVDQEVQFRFDNGVWNAHQRKRGVEVTIEGRTPDELKITPNHHYNGTFLEPWGERSQRGYGIEVLRRFFEEVAFVEFGGPAPERSERLHRMRCLDYNDLSADRNTVAVVQALEAILERHARGQPNCVVEVNQPEGGLVLRSPGHREPEILYPQPV